ncbi:TrmH family RNA methyltransferase [Roseivirga sp. BDSF3-8]|uniref:TrmH family RNA methyltransferase n=1 Tax=Roseivirga sp. BDSF3-8 TaxID=3241598 RepID=UPI0035319B72
MNAQKNTRTIIFVAMRDGTMVSKSTAKFIRSLQIKKYRQKAQAFLVEGEKSVAELLQSHLHIDKLVAAPEFIEKYGTMVNKKVAEPLEASPAEISSLGSFKTNEAALAVVRMPDSKPAFLPEGRWGLILDDVRNPGNLGTIIRIADWYGFHSVICSRTCADFFNPKTIAATMGSFSRIVPAYASLPDLLGSVSVPVYGAYLEGQDIHKAQALKPGWLVMGNESTGIRDELDPFISQPITIPGQGQAESLNVAIATAVLCDNLVRLSKET